MNMILRGSLWTLWGVAAFFASRAIERMLGAGALGSVGVEEAVKFALAAAAASWTARRALPPSFALFGVTAATAFGTLENLAYMLSFGDALVYARLGFAFPVHVVTAAAYCLAYASPRAGLLAPAALAAGLAYHAAINLAALSNPSMAAILAISVANMAILAALYAASYRIFFPGGTKHGDT